MENNNNSTNTFQDYSGSAPLPEHDPDIYNEKLKFDEMQLQKRNVAYKIGFYVTIGFNLLFLFLSDYVTMEFALTTSLYIGLSAFIFYCVLNNAYFHFNDPHPTINAVLFGLLGIMDFVSFYRKYIHGDHILKGNMLHSSASYLSLCGGILFSGLAILYIIRIILNNREEKS